MESDPGRIPFYIAASTVAIAVAIHVASLGRPNAPRLAPTIMVASLISAIGILAAKFGANYGLPWQVYYSVPMLATLFAPPIAFRFSITRASLYAALAFLSAPAIHFVFYYSLGWADYMPFLDLSR